MWDNVTVLIEYTSGYPCTPHHGSTPLQNSGTPWGVQYTRLTSTGLEKDTDRMCPSSPRQTWSSNLNHTASQLFQVASPRADQRRLL